ncbi:sialin-like [Penaeus japonicus]|uniref:sialin-like n=1 Tax=Penaeus japonicus TaxID=27405 RepID=UPI001C715179|nr:sialin-like [Penaeus japonicus]XP_042857349.1 sialin-like [Penaeus japonicus]
MSLSLGTVLSTLEPDQDSQGGSKEYTQEDAKKPQELLDPVSLPGSSSLALIDDVDSGDAPKEWWGARHTLCFLGFIGFTSVYAMRVNLSVAIVAMVKTEVEGGNGSTGTNNSEVVCPLPDDYDPATDANEDGEFEWSGTTQGLILGCFFYGYLLTNILGGRAAEYLGGKLVFGLGVVITAILTIVSPFCARISTGLFIAVRVLEGMAEGVTFPAMNSLLPFWIPPLERAKFTTLVFSGAQFGTVVTMPVSGWLCDSGFLGGWPSVFYVFGVLGALWGVAWFLLISDHPSKHPRISSAEKNYIMKHCCVKGKKATPIPWKAILTSAPVWGIMIIHFGQNWGFYTLLTELPTYLKNIQHFDMKSNGVISSLPYLVMWIFSLLFSSLMDKLLSAGKLTTLNVRRLAMTIGVYAPTLGLIAMCFVNCDAVLAVVVLCISVGLNGAVYSGYMCSHQDLAPNLAGTLMGLTNTVATIPGFAAPQLTGAITDGNNNLGGWRTVFLISSGVYFVTCTVYLLLITTETQPWNEVKLDDDEEVDGPAKERY